MASSSIQNADFANIYNSRINLVHKPAPANNAKELAETYETIQSQINQLNSPEKNVSSPAKLESVVEDIYLSRLATVH